MGVALVTGSAGLIGSEAVRFFAAKGFDVVGIDNDMRQYFFGDEASTAWQIDSSSWPRWPAYRHLGLRHPRPARRSRRSSPSTDRDIRLVVHTAAQPSHDWAAREPHTDFGVNANGTLNLLEATRQHCPEAVFIFTSTNKVYGDTPNRLPLREARDPLGDRPRPSASPNTASTRRCRSTTRRTRCSAPPRSPPTCWCRSTAATSA